VILREGTGRCPCINRRIEVEAGVDRGQCGADQTVSVVDNVSMVGLAAGGEAVPLSAPAVDDKEVDAV